MDLRDYMENPKYEGMDLDMVARIAALKEEAGMYGGISITSLIGKENNPVKIDEKKMSGVPEGVLQGKVIDYSYTDDKGVNPYFVESKFNEWLGKMSNILNDINDGQISGESKKIPGMFDYSSLYKEIVKGLDSKPEEWFNYNARTQSDDKRVFNILSKDPKESMKIAIAEAELHNILLEELSSLVIKNAPDDVMADVAEVVNHFEGYIAKAKQLLEVFKDALKKETLSDALEGITVSKLGGYSKYALQRGEQFFKALKMESFLVDQNAKENHSSSPKFQGFKNISKVNQKLGGIPATKEFFPKLKIEIEKEIEEKIKYYEKLGKPGANGKIQPGSMSEKDYGILTKLYSMQKAFKKATSKGAVTIPKSIWEFFLLKNKKVKVGSKEFKVGDLFMQDPAEDLMIPLSEEVKIPADNLMQIISSTGLNVEKMRSIGEYIKSHNYSLEECKMFADGIKALVVE